MNIVWWYTYIDLHCDGSFRPVEEAIMLDVEACGVVCGNIFVVVFVVAVVDDFVGVDDVVDGTQTPP